MTQELEADTDAAVTQELEADTDASCRTKSGSDFMFLLQAGTLNGVIGVSNTIGYSGLDSIVAKQNLQEDDSFCRLKIAKMKNKFGAIVEPSANTAQVRLLQIFHWVQL